MHCHHQLLLMQEHLLVCELLLLLILSGIIVGTTGLTSLLCLILGSVLHGSSVWHLVGRGGDLLVLVVLGLVLKLLLRLGGRDA